VTRSTPLRAGMVQQEDIGPLKRTADPAAMALNSAMMSKSVMTFSLGMET
jgi:hypothetical protein